MRIAGSSIAFQATHQEVQRREEKAGVRFWVDDTAPAARQEPADRVEVSAKGKHQCECAHQKQVDEANEDLETLAPEVRFIKGLLEAWLGRVIEFDDPITEEVDVTEPEPIPSPEQIQEKQIREEPERVGWGPGGRS